MRLKLARIVAFSFLGMFLFAGWMWNYRICKVPAFSMEPTIKRGSKIKVSTSAYKSSIPERWDVVIFKRKNRTMGPTRVVALPGEVAHIKDGEIYINGKLEKKPISIKAIRYTTEGEYGAEKTTIPKDCLFFLGDNSLNSRDSRYFGLLPLKSVVGKVIRIYPETK